MRLKRWMMIPAYYPWHDTAISLYRSVSFYSADAVCANYQKKNRVWEEWTQQIREAKGED